MIAKQLKSFLQSSDHNRWIYHRKMRVYVRKSTRYLRISDQKGVTYKCLDIANIEVTPKYQRQGIFKKVLQTCIDQNLFSMLFIENVLNKDLYTWLMRQFYIHPCIDQSCCFYILDEKHDTQSNHTQII